MSSPQWVRSDFNDLPQVEPIIPLERRTAFDDPAWLFEPKYEGFRGVMYLTREACAIRSKQGRALRRFASLCGAVREQVGADSAILDGEVVALDRLGHPQFLGLLGSKIARLAYVAFDILWVNGRDLRPLTLSQRKAELASVLPSESSALIKPFVEEEHGWALFEVVRRLNLEGIIAKRKADPYRPHTVWFKINNPGYTHAHSSQLTGSNRS